MAFCFYKAMYFLVATCWGYHVLKDQYYMSWLLGGKGEFVLSFKEYPYAKHAPMVKEYLLVTMGYHVGGLMNHFLHPRRSDYLEMALHHLLTIYLFGGCYLFNVWETGAVIAFLHDTADITTNIIKTLAETNYSTITAVVFVIHMAFWFYTRLSVLPYFIYNIIMVEVDFGSPIVKAYFVFLLSSLCLLHAYWFKLFVYHISKYVKSGDTENEQDTTLFVKKEKANKVE